MVLGAWIKIISFLMGIFLYFGVFLIVLGILVGHVYKKWIAPNRCSVCGKVVREMDGVDHFAHIHHECRS